MIPLKLIQNYFNHTIAIYCFLIAHEIEEYEKSNSIIELAMEKIYTRYQGRALETQAKNFRNLK